MGDPLRLIDGCVARGELRTAAQAWAERRLLRGFRARKKAAVLALWRLHRADRPAIDTGGSHADIKHPVEAGVARSQRFVGGMVIDHGSFRIVLLSLSVIRTRRAGRYRTCHSFLPSCPKTASTNHENARC